MKKTYIIPLIKVETIEMEQTILVTSQLSTSSDTQSIIFEETEYNGEFSTKDNPFEGDIFE